MGNNRPTTEPLFYNIEETAYRLGNVSRRTVYALFEDGSLTPVYVRSSPKVVATELAAFIERQLKSERDECPETRTASTGGPTPATGGPYSPTAAVARLDDRLNAPRRKKPKSS